MNIVLVNPPHTAIGSRVPDDHLPPLGLLAIGGPLLDVGHSVRLVDAEFGPMPLSVLVDDALSGDPQFVLIGHSGSTSAHPTALRIAAMIKARAPGVIIVYGGVFPTYHWRDVLAATGVFDFIVRGEGGMENTDEETLSLICKGGSTKSDREAIRLLRQHGILSMATSVAGFEDEGFRDLWRGFRQLIAYDPDQIQALYVTPHRWTPFFRIAKDRKVIQKDIRLWDYKHQVLHMTRLKPWMLFFCVKLIELAVQSRAKALARILFHPDPEQRHSMRWYTKMGRRVWFREVWGFLVRDRRMTDGPTLAEFWGAPQDAEEESMFVGRPGRRPATAVIEGALVSDERRLAG